MEPNPEPSLLVVGTPRRRGRPPLSPSGTSASVHLKVSAEDYDRVFAAARKSRRTVQEVIRGAIRHAIRDERGGPIR